LLVFFDKYTIYRLIKEVNFKKKWLSNVIHSLHTKHSAYFTRTLLEDRFRSRAICLKIPYSIPRLFSHTNMLFSLAIYYWIVKYFTDIRSSMTGAGKCAKFAESLNKLVNKTGSDRRRCWDSASLVRRKPSATSRKIKTKNEKKNLESLNLV